MVGRVYAIVGACMRSNGRCKSRMADLLPFIRWLHLLAAATWTGGLIVLAAVVVALRKAGADRSLLQAAARQFGRVSWAAMAIAVVTGVAQVHAMGIAWTYGRLHIKLALVATAIVVAAVHTVTARRSSAAARGVQQLVILLLGLAIFGAAVRL
jgi:uncharacterized membrane protein